MATATWTVSSTITTTTVIIVSAIVLVSRFVVGIFIVSSAGAVPIFSGGKKKRQIYHIEKTLNIHPSN